MHGTKAGAPHAQSRQNPSDLVDLENLEIEDVDAGEPGPGEVRLRQEASAVHFADTLVREGTYFLKPELPSGLGLEGAGVVEAVGDGVS